MENEIERVRKFRLAKIEGQIERFKWLKAIEEKLIINKYNTWPSISRLYGEAAYCYIHECYYAVVTIICSVIQLHLRLGLFPHTKRPKDWDEYWKYYLKYSTSNLVDMAKKGGHITPKLADKLIWIIKTMRHPIVHPDDEFGFGLDFLGLPRVGVGTWGVKDGPLSHDPPNAAKVAIESYLLLNKEFPLKKPK